MSLKDYKHVHCIGIGGIGLSAIARYCNSNGATVTGSDNGTSSRITEDLQKEGVTVYYGHSSVHIAEETDLVIYTIAVTENNPEFKVAQERGIKCMTYPEALGLLTEEYTTIAVCGTHGKTTTTAMVNSMFKGCGISPTVIVGSLLSEGGLNAIGNNVASPDHSKNGLGTNFVQGDSEYLVVEACEYKRSFLNLSPKHILVTNIDEDHLDYYKDLKDIESAFQSFVDKLKDDGYLVTHGDVSLNTIGKKINADSIDSSKIELSVLGEHNKKNAQLVLALAQALGLKDEQARIGLEDFTGTWRRLEYKGTYKRLNATLIKVASPDQIPFGLGVQMFDDYGHHPKEVMATLEAIREKYKSGKFKLVVVFQPHLFSRTKLLLDDFAKAFILADKICVLPIYASREQDDGTISSHDLVEKMDNAIYMESFDEVKKYIDKNAHSGSIVLTIGAGDVYRLHELFV